MTTVEARKEAASQKEDVTARAARELQRKAKGASGGLFVSPDFEFASFEPVFCQPVFRNPHIAKLLETCNRVSCAKNRHSGRYMCPEEHRCFRGRLLAGFLFHRASNLLPAGQLGCDHERQHHAVYRQRRAAAWSGRTLAGRHPCQRTTYPCSLGPASRFRLVCVQSRTLAIPSYPSQSRATLCGIATPLSRPVYGQSVSFRLGRGSRSRELGGCAVQIVEIRGPSRLAHDRRTTAFCRRRGQDLLRARTGRENDCQCSDASALISQNTPTVPKAGGCGHQDKHSFHPAVDCCRPQWAGAVGYVAVAVPAETHLYPPVRRAIRSPVNWRAAVNCESRQYPTNCRAPNSVRDLASSPSSVHPVNDG